VCWPRSAVDFLLKPVDDVTLLDAIQRAVARHAATRGETAARAQIEERLRRLSPREHVVMERVILGHANKRIAIDLGITEDTVKVHRGRVMRKLQVRSVADLVRLCENTCVRPARPSSDLTP
jgi:FixJ family two-component response regulator